MLKSLRFVLAVLAASLFTAPAQNLTGRRAIRPANTFIVSAQISDEGTFQLQRSGSGLANWTNHSDIINSHPGTNGFSDTMTNAQSYYRLIRLTNAPAITTQPAGTTNFFNQEVRLEVAFTGSWPIRIYWYKDGQLIANATTNVHAFAGRTNLSGNYTVAISNHWGVASSTPVTVKTINPVAATVRDKKIQYVIKGAQGGFISSGSFETTYGGFGYATTSSNFNLNDQGQWQYGILSENIGRAVWNNGIVYPNNTYIDMTFTNLIEGTFNLQVPNVNGRQFGEFKFMN